MSKKKHTKSSRSSSKTRSSKSDKDTPSKSSKSSSKKTNNDTANTLVDETKTSLSLAHQLLPPSQSPVSSKPQLHTTHDAVAAETSTSSLLDDDSKSNKHKKKSSHSSKSTKSKSQDKSKESSSKKVDEGTMSSDSIAANETSSSMASNEQLKRTSRDKKKRTKSKSPSKNRTSSYVDGSLSTEYPISNAAPIPIDGTQQTGQSSMSGSVDSRSATKADIGLSDQQQKLQQQQQAQSGKISFQIKKRNIIPPTTSLNLNTMAPSSASLSSSATTTSQKSQRSSKRSLSRSPQARTRSKSRSRSKDRSIVVDQQVSSASVATDSAASTSVPKVNRKSTRSPSLRRSPNPKRVRSRSRSHRSRSRSHSYRPRRRSRSRTRSPRSRSPRSSHKYGKTSSSTKKPYSTSRTGGGASSSGYRSSYRRGGSRSRSRSRSSRSRRYHASSSSNMPSHHRSKSPVQAGDEYVSSRQRSRSRSPSTHRHHDSPAAMPTSSLPMPSTHHSHNYHSHKDSGRYDYGDSQGRYASSRTRSNQYNSSTSSAMGSRGSTSTSSFHQNARVSSSYHRSLNRSFDQNDPTDLANTSLSDKNKSSEHIDDLSGDEKSSDRRYNRMPSNGSSSLLPNDINATQPPYGRYQHGNYVHLNGNQRHSRYYSSNTTSNLSNSNNSGTYYGNNLNYQSSVGPHQASYSSNNPGTSYRGQAPYYANQPTSGYNPRYQTPYQPYNKANANMPASFGGNMNSNLKYSSMRLNNTGGYMTRNYRFSNYQSINQDIPPHMPSIGRYNPNFGNYFNPHSSSHANMNGGGGHDDEDDNEDDVDENESAINDTGDDSADEQLVNDLDDTTTRTQRQTLKYLRNQEKVTSTATAAATTDDEMWDNIDTALATNAMDDYLKRLTHLDFSVILNRKSNSNVIIKRDESEVDEEIKAPIRIEDDEMSSSSSMMLHKNLFEMLYLKYKKPALLVNSNDEEEEEESEEELLDKEQSILSLVRFEFLKLIGFAPRLVGADTCDLLVERLKHIDSRLDVSSSDDLEQLSDQENDLDEIYLVQNVLDVYKRALASVNVRPNADLTDDLSVLSILMNKSFDQQVELDPKANTFEPRGLYMSKNVRLRRALFEQSKDTIQNVRPKQYVTTQCQSHMFNECLALF